MTQNMERYLSSVKLWMFGMPGKAKKGIVDELRAHIIDSSNAQGDPAAIGYVVSQMESPRKTAKRYKQIYGYGLPLKVLFVIITIFLSIWTVPIWEIVNPNFSTTFVFLLLIIFLFFVGSRAGKKMALTAGISALLTRFIILGLIAAALGEHGIIQGGGLFLFLLSSILLILVAYQPARTIEKWEQRRLWDVPFPYPAQPVPAPPQPYSPQPSQPVTSSQPPYPHQPPQPVQPAAEYQALSNPKIPHNNQAVAAHICPNCATDLSVNSQFCRECGTKVNSDKTGAV
ncbi:MAG: zinc ribbon domain-containing protein [Thermoplasmata archaeon]|nr:MAG: zinc ribbon domain-containing protein [Thermoplasmata archaeon]